MLNVILAIVHPHSLLASMETLPVLLVPGDPRQVSAEVHLALCSLELEATTPFCSPHVMLLDSEQ